MVTDQFLTRLDSHELRVQAATTGARRIEDLVRIARSLEAVEGKETSRRTRRGHTQARFTKESEGYEFWSSCGQSYSRARMQSTVLLCQGHRGCAGQRGL